MARIDPFPPTMQTLIDCGVMTAEELALWEATHSNVRMQVQEIVPSEETTTNPFDLDGDAAQVTLRSVALRTNDDPEDPIEPDPSLCEMRYWDQQGEYPQAIFFALSGQSTSDRMTVVISGIPNS